MRDYAESACKASAPVQQPPTDSEHLVNRLTDRLDGIRAVSKRLSSLSDRLLGQRPADASKEAGAGTSPQVMPFCQRVNSLHEQMSKALSECFSSLGALETFI